MSAPKLREGTLRKGRSLRSDDRALIGLTAEERRRFRNGHVRAHGSFSGLADFAEKFDRAAALASENGGELAKEFAAELARESARIKDALKRGAVGETDAIYLGVCAGFLFANLQREVERSSRPASGGKITKKAYFDALKKFGPKPRVIDIARELSVTSHGLIAWRKRNGLAPAGRM